MTNLASAKGLDVAPWVAAHGLHSAVYLCEIEVADLVSWMNHEDHGCRPGSSAVSKSLKKTNGDLRDEHPRKTILD